MTDIEEKKLGKDILSPDFEIIDLDPILSDLSNMVENDIGDELDITGVIEEILGRILTNTDVKENISHYLKAIELAEYVSSYNVFHSWLYDDPRMTQRTKFAFHSDMDNITWCTAHKTYIQVYSMIQSN